MNIQKLLPLLLKKLYSYFDYERVWGCIMEDRNSTSKMTPEQLEKWIALRKKCHVHKSKKDYTRKEKHKKDYVE